MAPSEFPELVARIKAAEELVVVSRAAFESAARDLQAAEKSLAELQSEAQRAMREAFG